MENDNIKTAIDTGALLASPKTTTPKGTPYTLIPANSTVQDLSKFLEKPLRIRQAPQFDQSGSFIRYVNEFKENESVMFARLDENGASFTAVLDYHNEEPAWCDHVASYNCPLTVEWKRWKGGDGKSFNQTAFAEFIEQNQLEIVKPTGAEMLEVAQTLKAKSNVDFVSGVRLANGNQQLNFQETTSAQAGVNGNLSVPEAFELGLPVFQGGPRYSVTAFLRYRISDKKLSFTYVLFNPHKVIEHAAQAVFDEIKTGSKIDPFMGKP